MVHQFYGLIVILGSFSRISDGHPYPFYLRVPPPFGNCCNAWTVVALYGTMHLIGLDR